MKPGDIIFWKATEHFSGRFYIVLESISGKFKYFSSFDGKLFVSSLTSLRLNHLSEGLWEFK